MKQLVFTEPRHLQWQHVDEPTPGPGEALVRVRRCGICGTDLHAFAGEQPLFSFPRVPGHELAVEVVEAPTDSGLTPGDLCAVEAYHFCGACPACLVGRTNCCSRLRVYGVHIDGGMKDMMCVPVDKLHGGAGLSVEQLALVEPLVIGAHAVERAAIAPNEPTVVIGAGPIGLAAALFVRAEGSDPVVVDIAADRLRFADEKLGFNRTEIADAELPERLRQRFDGALPFVVIDATGNPRSMESCFALPEQGGRIVYLGLVQGELAFNDTNFHCRELTLLASRSGLPTTFANVIEAIRTGRIDPLPMVTHRITFEELPERFGTLMGTSGLVKAMVSIRD